MRFHANRRILRGPPPHAVLTEFRVTVAKLTLKDVRARPVIVPLKRPIVSRVGLFEQWPLILIDLETNEGVVGRSYLEPYLAHRPARSCR